MVPTSGGQITFLLFTLALILVLFPGERVLLGLLDSTEYFFSYFEACDCLTIYAIFDMLIPAGELVDRF